MSLPTQSLSGKLNIFKLNTEALVNIGSRCYDVVSRVRRSMISMLKLLCYFNWYLISKHTTRYRLTKMARVRKKSLALYVLVFMTIG